jgi:hypothetical protein
MWIARTAQADVHVRPLQPLNLQLLCWGKLRLGPPTHQVTL